MEYADVVSSDSLLINDKEKIFSVQLVINSENG
jgi:hypothetical protein